MDDSIITEGGSGGMPSDKMYIPIAYVPTWIPPDTIEGGYDGLLSK